MSKFIAAPALKPLSAVLPAVTDTMVFLPMHGGGSASIAINGVTRGYPTTVGLASAYTGIVGQTIKISGVAGMTALNGYRKVIDKTATGVVLDIDTTDITAYPAWTSGGSIVMTVLADAMDTITPLDVLGTTTGIWANQPNGLTSHLAGTWVDKLSGANLTPFDLTSFSGIAVLAFDYYVGTAPGSRETIFGMGVIPNGTNSRFGTLTASINGGGNAIELVFRPATAADAGGSNTFAYGASIGLGVSGHVAFVFDLTSTTSATVHCINNGVLTSSVNLVLTNRTNWPSTSGGVAIGAGMDAALAITSKFGAGATTQSAGRVQNLLWWKTNKSLTTVLRAVNALSQQKVPDWEMV